MVAALERWRAVLLVKSKTETKPSALSAAQWHAYYFDREDLARSGAGSIGEIDDEHTCGGGHCPAG
jgi:hypothetical protein